MAELPRRPDPKPAPAAVKIGAGLYRIPMAAGVWVISTNESPNAELPRGLYQRERDDETQGPAYAHRAQLPFVWARIIRRDGSGDRTDTDYLISAERESPRVIVSSAKVRRGDWAGAVGIPLSDDSKIIAAAGTAIRYMKPLDREYDGEREAIPRNGPDGRAVIPAPETLPPGYLRTGPASRDDALAQWRDVIAPVAAGNPCFALALGASAISPFVGWLDYADCRAFILDLAGEPNAGKSTTARAAGAVWGAVPKHGAGVVGAWNLSAQGPGRALGMLGILPAIFDEQAVSGYSPDQWARIILTITDGSRRAADREGGLRVTLPYSGVVISAGNASIASGLGAGRYAGIGPKRVNTLPGPFTGSAEQAESVKPVLRDACGHPGRVILERFTGAEVSALVTEAAQIIGLPSGATSRSAGKNMHLLTAGAAILDAVLGTGTALRDSAATGARQYLAGNCHEPEHDADRMLAALRESIASAPARWPTVAEYREHRLPRPVYGQDGSPDAAGRVELPQHGIDRQIAGVRADDGSWFAAFGTFLDDLLSRAGADRAIALAEADKRGWLHRTASDRRAGKLGTKIMHIPGRPYRFDLPADDDQDHEPEPEPAPAGPASAERCPECNSPRPLHSADCPTLPPLPPEDYEPELWADREREPEPEPEPESGPESREPEPGPGAAEIPATVGQVIADGIAAAEPPFWAEVRGYLAECERDGIRNPYHPTADGAVKVIRHGGPDEAGMIREAFARITGAEGHGRAGSSRDHAMEPAGDRRESPAVAETTIAPEPGRPGREAAGSPTAGPRDREDQDHEPARGRAAADDAAEREAFAREVLSAYPDAEPADITAALALFRDAYGLRFIRSASWTGITSLRRDVALFGSKSAPARRSAPILAEIREAGPLRHVAFVVPGQTVKPGMRFTGWDINGQHPAAAGSAYLGTGEPEHVKRPRKVAPFLSMPGYVQTASAIRTGHPAYGTIPKGEWVTMPHAKFLTVDLGLDLSAAGIVYWPKGNASKHLATFTARYRKAREALQGRPGLPARYALAVAKAVANKTIGMLRSEDHNRTEFFLPDWYDQTVATAEANMLRHLRKIDRAGGGMPIGKCADGAWWISGAERERPAGLEESAQLGKWKLEKWGLVTPEIASAYRDRNPGALQSAIKAADAARREGGRS